ncbi:right-handed parallel beta-helix repeat-containing protein [Bremerella volcania]|nr:right-handed parallel beta-helix repeat-containing protein [Bremerella volcania]
MLLAIIVMSVSLANADEPEPIPLTMVDVDTTVRAFGAGGDGVSDDTEAIQNAINAGSTAIRLPRGTYRISKPLVVDLDKVGVTSIVGDGTARIMMTGPGPAIRFVGTHQGTASPKTVKSNVWQKERMPLVDGIEIIGTHDEADGIEAVRTMQLTISRVIIRHTRHAIHLVERNRNVILSDCHLYENHGVGVFLDNVDLHQINLSACHVSYNDGGGFVSKGGNVRNIHISGCDLEANVQNVLIDSDGSKYGTAEVAITGCTIQHSGGPGSANVRFIGANPEGERCWGLVTIANNILSDVETNIDIQQARDVIINGNTISSGYKFNLRVEDSMNVVVGPNVLARNPPYRDEDTCDNAVLFRNCNGGTITGLHVHETRRTEAGIMLDACRRFHMTGCTVLDCDNAGLLLKNLEDCQITGNMLRHGTATKEKWQPMIVLGGRETKIAP